MTCSLLPEKKTKCAISGKETCVSLFNSLYKIGPSSRTQAPWVCSNNHQDSHNFLFSGSSCKNIIQDSFPAIRVDLTPDGKRGSPKHQLRLGSWKSGSSTTSRGILRIHLRHLGLGLLIWKMGQYSLTGRKILRLKKTFHLEAPGM